MTRSASPNGAVEFSYDFPVAGPSTLRTPPTTAPRHTRTRSPARPRWEASPAHSEHNNHDDDDDDAEAAAAYDAFGYPYPRAHRAHPIPIPTATRNQWLAPAPAAPAYPYGWDYSPSASPSYNNYTTSAYGGYAYAPQPSSCDSALSALSAFSSTHKEKEGGRRCPGAGKIRKPRRSVDSDSSPRWDSYDLPSPASPSSFDSPRAFDSPRSLERSLSHDDYALGLENDEDADAEDEEADVEPHALPPSPTLTLRRHWAALALRVRFGVFRAKRRMRNRVLSL
ncbi:hypothetical protein C8R46DRAFT_1041879 [Mycena filopes]|nr:hypothetical protein C8R46DRAFT_1041879 [Mycena filopes]